MKKLAFFLLLAFMACNKNSEPISEPQIENEENIRITGKNGSTVYSGRTNPNDKIGKTGDFYINLQSNILYGPKLDIGWGAPFTMSESNSGTQSTTVNTILSGIGMPTQVIGNNGDFYIDLEEYSIYGPKNDQTIWGDPVSLKADNENGVWVYTFKPVFKNNFSIDTVEYDGYFPGPFYFEIKGESQIFSIPGKNNRLNQLYYRGHSRYDMTAPISSTTWTNFSKNFSIEKFPQSLDYGFETINISIIEDNTIETVHDSIEFQLGVNSIANFYLSDSLSIHDLDFIVKSVKIDRMEELSKANINPSRFLRLR